MIYHDDPIEQVERNDTKHLPWSFMLICLLAGGLLVANHQYAKWLQPPRAQVARGPECLRMPCQSYTWIITSGEPVLTITTTSPLPDGVMGQAYSGLISGTKVTK